MNIQNGSLSNSNIIDLDSISNHNRTLHDIMDGEFRKDMDGFKPDININFIEYKDDNVPIMIYRFKFTEEFMEELYKFSKIHQYDERKDFKEAWKVWIEENDDIINEEMRRLMNLGYEGDVLDKMFKSARYYFRKKSTEKKEPKTRRQYITVDKSLLEAMDVHIEENMYNKDYQPKTGFVQFCKDNKELLLESITNIYKQNITDSSLIEDKIKKTYKNRYFILTNNKQVKTL
jgi:hypothetical protein